MLDGDLIGLWSADARYGPGAQSDDWLIFKPDGTGRYEFSNWTLCSADLFRWDIPKPGVVRISTDRRLQLSDDCRSVEEVASPFGEQEVEYRIAEEDTPSGKRMRVLRLALNGAMTNCYGFGRRELDESLDQPRFSPLK
jgi:hypothetical protein